MNSGHMRFVNSRWVGSALAAFGILLSSSPAIARQRPLLERLAESRQLYESAEYDKALAVMETIDPRGMAPDLARDRALYQALCLFALGLRVEAAARVEAAFELDPLFRPGGDLSPRAQSFIDEVRNRVRPSLAHERYRAAKALFDSGRYDAAVKEFTIVLDLVKEDRAVAERSELADVRTLASGFRDLAEHALSTGRERVRARARDAASGGHQPGTPRVARQPAAFLPAQPQRVVRDRGQRTRRRRIRYGPQEHSSGLRPAADRRSQALAVPTCDQGRRGRGVCEAHDGQRHRQVTVLR